MITPPHHVDPTAYVEELLAQASPGLIAGRFLGEVDDLQCAEHFYNANTAGAMV
jgi:hypothetical protein